MLKQQCIPGNLKNLVEFCAQNRRKRCYRFDVLNEQKEFLALHRNLYPDQQVIFENLRSGPQLPNEITFASYKKLSVAHKKAKTNGRPLKQASPAKTNDADVLSLNQIYGRYAELKKAGLTRFDPIRADPADWMDKFETFTAKHGQESSESRLTIVPYFLEHEPPKYLEYYWRAKKNSSDFKTFRERFVQEFASYKSREIQKAFSYQFNDGDLVDYTKRKFKLIERVFPDLSEFDKIRSVIAGMNRAHLIEHFSVNMAPNKDQFMIKVTELELGIPH